MLSITSINTFPHLHLSFLSIYNCFPLCESKRCVQKLGKKMSEGCVSGADAFKNWKTSEGCVNGADALTNWIRKKACECIAPLTHAWTQEKNRLILIILQIFFPSFWTHRHRLHIYAWTPEKKRLLLYCELGFLECLKFNKYTLLLI
jgi:hypothetical protein